jgi:hypothetical protein
MVSGSADIAGVGGGSSEERMRALVTRFGEEVCSSFPQWLCTQTQKFLLSLSKIVFGYTTEANRFLLLHLGATKLRLKLVHVSVKEKNSHEDCTD